MDLGGIQIYPSLSLGIGDRLPSHGAAKTVKAGTNWQTGGNFVCEW
jgi:hypothetical protein